MLLSVFEKYIFLQSLGWGIANSLWQVALLWLIYQSVTAANKKLPPLFKYHFSLMLLFASFGWFISTTIQNYIAIKNSGSGITPVGWLNVSDDFIASLQWLSVTYFVVLAVHLLLFVKKLNDLFSLKKSGFIKVPVDIRLFTEQTAFHIGIKKKVSIWFSEKATVPSVIGFFKPIILLPVTALNHLTTEQAEAVILHELAHIKRYDFLVNFVQSFIEMLLFFNPFARLLGNAARKERENCCDDWVLNYKYNKHEYASALLILEQNRRVSTPFALAATNGKKNLLGRVKRLFAEEPVVNFNFVQRVKLASVYFTILLAIFFVLPVANNKTVAENKQIHGTAFSASIATPVVFNNSEVKGKPMINDKPLPAKPVKEKIKIIKKPAANVIPEETEYNNTAFINEDLLNQVKQIQLQEMAIQAANKGLEAANKIIVKIEEEQSGIKDKKAYYVALNNDNGVPEVKPLIILTKKAKEISEKTKAKKVSAGKKRTTA